MSDKIESSETTENGLESKPGNEFGFKGLVNQNSVNYFDNYLNQFKNQYQQLGFIQVGVFADISEQGNKVFPCFTYTVGIEENYNLPELIVVGVDNQMAANVINNIMHQVRIKDFIPEPFKVYDQFTSVKMCLVPVMVPAKETLMTLTSLFYLNKNKDTGIENIDFNVFQIIWADTQNKFPWEEGFEEEFMEDALCLFDEKTFDKLKDLK